ESASCFAEGAPRLMKFRMRHALRRMGIPLNSAWIPEVELNCMVLGDVFALAFLHSIETLAISVDHLEAMPHFVHPKVQVGRLPGELVPVKSDKPRQLFGQSLCNVGGICHSNPSPLFFILFLLLRRDRDDLRLRHSGAGADADRVLAGRNDA